MTPEAAVDSMFAEITQCTPANVEIIWTDVPSNKPLSNRWIRPTVKHVAGEQSSLSGALGSKQHKMTGLLIVQCFVPSGSGGLEAVQLATVYVNHFAAIRNSAIWYRNQHFVEVGNDGPSLQYNVVIEFEYDITIVRI